MKKVLKTLLIALTALCLTVVPALALSGSGYPGWDNSTLVQNALLGSFDAQPIRLEFDTAADYSFQSDSGTQICFFAFDESESYYLELYLSLPAELSAGMMIDAAYAEANGLDQIGLSLFEVSENSAVEYDALPVGSGRYSIGILSVETTPDGLHVDGMLNATLVSADGTSIALKDAAFDFTLSAPSAAGDGRGATPAFTLPPDSVAV